MTRQRGEHTNRSLLFSLRLLLNIFLPHSPRRRRRHYHHVLPLISAVAGCLVFLFAFVSFLTPSHPPSFIHHAPPPPAGHLHRVSLLLKNRIEARMSMMMNVQKDVVFRVPRRGGELAAIDPWTTNQSTRYYSCSNATRNFPSSEMKTQPNRYLLIATSGGLNQQRTGITDAVVAAYILNATLVVPTLDQKSYWKDSSNFSDIFDVDRFISYLSKDIKIIKQLPLEGGKVMIPVRTSVPRKCNPRCYETNILPLLKKKNVVQIRKFDFRLANQLDVDLQKLRCRVNYHALQYTDPIHRMGRKLVDRMRMKSKHFIALHLRFEPDMLAFSGCYYGGGEKERNEFSVIRKWWKTLHAKDPERERRNGKCPLSPEEIGLMLRALGFGDDVHIYVASGEVYGGEETLAPLRSLFPNLHSKDTIASKEELAPFSSFSSRMAALDFIVCDESDVFVTNNNGNMAKILAGRRRYFGHKATIRPNAKKLYRLFMNRDNMTWEEFASQTRTHQIGLMGEPNEVRPGTGGFHENPTSCICKHSDEAKNRREFVSQNKATISYKMGMADVTMRDAAGELEYDQLNEDEQDWADTDYVENENGSVQGRGLPGKKVSDSSSILKHDQPDTLDEMLSD
ncbi:hypothetical protein ACH5RR_021849 [Cinchona calisaya]|uniref:O-fucosyltransferase family protein n=1 Tax=Cinchona calisaya TaxID=153742 RepID=A0ABD2Z633_9GENT